MNKVFCFVTYMCFVFASCQESKTVHSSMDQSELAVQSESVSDEINDILSDTATSQELVPPDLETFRRKEEPHIVEEKKVATVKKTSKPKVLPVIAFEEPLHKVGEIKEGDVIEHKFYFTNEGKVPLEILKAEGTCGCTVPSFPFMGVDPGDKGFIGVQYHSVGKSGAQRPEINVTTNGTPSKITLALDIVVLDKEASITSKIDSTQKVD